MFWLMGLMLFAPPPASSLLHSDGNNAFFREQWRFKRFRVAWTAREASLKTLLKEKGLQAQVGALYLRAFKEDQLLEVWSTKGDGSYLLLAEWPICALSGALGPKRKQGDLQIPEGRYFIDRFNPASSYHLSLGINYPNRCDRILGDKDDPGDLIFIHGRCVTIGCLPIQDDPIEMLYSLCVAAKANGQRRILVDIFPTRLDEAGLQKLLTRKPKHKDFWENLGLLYRSFEAERRPASVVCGSDGRYRSKP